MQEEMLCRGEEGGVEGEEAREDRRGTSAGK